MADRAARPHVSVYCGVSLKCCFSPQIRVVQRRVALVEILERRRFRNTSRYSEDHGEQAARLYPNTGDTPYGVGVGVAVGVAVGVGVGLTTTTIVEVPVPSLGSFL